MAAFAIFFALFRLYISSHLPVALYQPTGAGGGPPHAVAANASHHKAAGTTAHGDVGGAPSISIIDPIGPYNANTKIMAKTFIMTSFFLLFLTAREEGEFIPRLPCGTNSVQKRVDL